MPVNLRVTRISAIRGIERIEEVSSSLSSVNPQFQYLLSEMLLIRLTSIIEAALEDFLCKLVCGAAYENGSTPVLLVHRTRSMAEARVAIMHKGKRTFQFPKWSSAQAIGEVCKGVVDVKDHFAIKGQVFGSWFSDLYGVRNYAAHRSASAKLKYQDVLLKTIGSRKAVPVGQFLLSPAFVPQANLYRIIAESKVILQSFSSGP
jgi:hypothetical protein